jgi:hypothetical protein
MANQQGNAYALTTLCPILSGVIADDPLDPFAGQSYTAYVRDFLQGLQPHEDSPMAKVPGTYFCRFYLLTDLMYGGKPNSYDELMSNYLVFTANFHGPLDKYLEGMWNAAKESIEKIWKHCVGFAGVDTADKFIEYIKKCQVTTTFFFNGSNDESLAEQLKALYLKQELSRFAFQNQGKSPAELQRAFQEFVKRAEPANVNSPSWRPGQATLS